MAMESSARRQGTAVRMGAEGRGHDERWSSRGSNGGLDPERLATGLGWFSIGLGVAEILAPTQLARSIGLKGRGVSRTVTRLVGVREIASGIGILTERRPTTWVWSRVIGDVMDLALLGAGFAARRTRRGRLTLATAAVAGVTALDAICAERLTAMTRASSGSPDGRSVRARKRVTINRPAEALYRFWRDVSNLPRFMQHVESVQATGDRRSHWRVRAPGGMPLELDSEITEERPNELIAWRSIEGALVQHEGVVRFEPAPAGRGTVMTAEMQYAPPGGAVTAAAAKLIGYAPEQQLQENLRRFKQLMETGQVVVVSESQLTGRGPAPGKGGAR